MDILIKGFGVVGKETAHYINTKGSIELGVPNLFFEDPAYGYAPDHIRYYAVVVCTPCREGYVDDISELAKIPMEHLVIRSTVTPDGLNEAKEKMPDDVEIHFWPEFLTETTAREDAMHPDKIVVGTDSYMNNTKFVKLAKILGFYQQDSTIISLEAASILKLAINTYYTTKVVFNNIIYDSLEHNDTDYADVMDAMNLDKRITVSHQNISQNGYRGAGGKNLPKDTRNFIKYLKENNLVSEAKVIEAFYDRNEELYNG